MDSSIDAPVANTPPFVPEKCLFCPVTSGSFKDSAEHMQKSHGLYIPERQHLTVDLETLFKYLHLVIFGYRECIQCGTQRATIQGVQQHMTGKGHCKFDIAAPDSEFAEFYDFFEPENDESEDDRDESEDGEGDEINRDEKATSPGSQPMLTADEDSIRLPSGKIISKHSSSQAGPSQSQVRRRAQRQAASRLEYDVVDEASADAAQEAAAGGAADDTRLLSRREKRERARVSYQLSNMSAGDKTTMMRLPAAEQRAIMATQHRHEQKTQKEEKKQRTKIDRKGNKNLYAYWHTETPVYQCG